MQSTTRAKSLPDPKRSYEAQPSGAGAENSLFEVMVGIIFCAWSTDWVSLLQRSAVKIGSLTQAVDAFNPWCFSNDHTWRHWPALVSHIHNIARPTHSKFMFQVQQHTPYKVIYSCLWSFLRTVLQYLIIMWVLLLIVFVLHSIKQKVKTHFFRSGKPSSCFSTRKGRL